jgi:aminopeptidase
MIDARGKLLAHNLINHSLKLKPGEKVLIETHGVDTPFMNELVKEAYAVGGLPFVNIKMPAIDRNIAAGCTEEQLKLMYKWEEDRMLAMDCYIGVRLPSNGFEESGVAFEKMELYNALYSRKLLMEVRCPTTRWVVLRYPTPAMAQAAQMNTEEFEDFYFNACCLDYGKMSKAMDPLKNLMDRTDKVRLTAKNTDISFSIKDIGAVKCDGSCNIPDGEVYSAPVRDSVNGYITYNTPSMVDGFCFEHIRLEFKNGEIVQATANDTERLNAILDTDEGARFVGEFAIGVNPYIERVMNDTLFDEKIMGSFHFTPGSCVMGCDNGNKSQIHWDLVLIQTPEFGGGTIEFDGEVIRKDGIFVREDLKDLNPENFK